MLIEPKTESEVMEDYDEYLNEIFGVVTICGYDYDAAQAFKQCDPVAYRCEFLNYCDAEGIDLDEL